jgi:hypothetical protein
LRLFYLSGSVVPGRRPIRKTRIKDCVLAAATPYTPPGRASRFHFFLENAKFVLRLATSDADNKTKYIRPAEESSIPRSSWS